MLKKNNKYKIGQKVRVINSPPSDAQHTGFVNKMNRFCGTVVTIAGYHDFAYTLKEDPHGFLWLEEWLFPVSQMSKFLHGSEET